jgi:prepilin-type N-terminal cleavage/methylation domain-containing protein
MSLTMTRIAGIGVPMQRVDVRKARRVAAVEFSRGRQPTENPIQNPQSRVAAAEGGFHASTKMADDAGAGYQECAPVETNSVAATRLSAKRPNQTVGSRPRLKSRAATRRLGRSLFDAMWNHALAGRRLIFRPETQGCALGYRITPLRGYACAARRGVTLIELLVVILIMLMITAITIPVIAPSMKNRDVREAARMIDVFINGARTRATQYNKSYGVMIERMPGNPNGAVTLSYCEQPDAYTGDYSTSTIVTLGNGGFALVPFPLLDAGWIAGPAPPVPPAATGTGYLTNIAPGDVLTIQGQQFRIWAGEPFIDIDQNGYCNVTAGFTPNTPVGVQEPFIDVDGSGTWTPPNYPNSPFGFVAAQPYVDPGSGYFVSPSGTSPFPTIVPGSQWAYITYAPYDPATAAQTISAAFVQKAQYGTPYTFGPFSGSFSFARRPMKTSAPSIQLPGGAVIDLGANYFFPGQPPNTPNIVAIPGSGLEVLGSNANALAWWSTFRPNPALDPTLQGSLASQPMTSATYQPPDPTSIMITFQPTGTVDRVYSWSEANNTNSGMSYVNWTDWQGRIPAGPIYLLIGRQELLNGDATLQPLIAEMATNNQAPKNPIYNVQDPNALWVTINPQTGAVATTENVGYDLTSIMLTGAGTPFQQMQIYWDANVYYARRLARAMLDMGGR